MAGIQAGINQLLTTAGVFATMNPALRAKADQRAQLSNLEQRKKVMESARDISQKPGEKEQYQGDIHNINKQIFETKPTEQSYKEYKESALHGEPILKLAEEPEVTAQEEVKEVEKQRAHEKLVDDMLKGMGQAPFYSKEQVMSNLQKKGMSQVEQKQDREDFMKTLKNAPVSFGDSASGGKFKDLPESLQKQIAEKLKGVQNVKE